MMKKTKLLVIILLTLYSQIFAISPANPNNFKDILLNLDFNNLPSGLYARKDFVKDWNNPAWNNGFDESRIFVVQDSDNPSSKCLKVLIPKGAVGPNEGGANWPCKFKRNYNEIYCAYRVKFGNKFDFVHGGKLPGLYGGENLWGRIPNGSDGWNAMIMWLDNGVATQYIYHPDQPEIWGERFGWEDSNGEVRFKANNWYQIEERVVMNTPNKKDGVFQVWLNKRLILDLHHLRFRNTTKLAIDSFYFVTFFGGNDATWATNKDEYVYFDDILIKGK